MEKQTVLLPFGKMAAGTLDTLSIKTITNGLNSAYIVTHDGKVYVMGDNSYSALGLDQSGAYVKTPKLLDPIHFKNEKIVDAKSQNVHALFLSETGKVYVCGANWNFPCGFSGQEYVAPPRQMPVVGMEGTPRAKKVATGIYHSLILLENNKLYGCGSGNSGELLDASANVEPPKDLRIERYTKDSKIVDIQGSNSASYVLTAEGKLFLFGKVKESGDFQTNSRVATAVDFPLPIRKFKGMYSCCVLQSADSQWHVFGNARAVTDNSIVALSPLSKNIPSSSFVHDTTQIEDIAGFYTLMFLTKDGRLFFLHDGNNDDMGVLRSSTVVDGALRQVKYTLDGKYNNMKVSMMSASSDSLFLLFGYPDSKIPKIQQLQTSGRLVDVVILF